MTPCPTQIISFSLYGAERLYCEGALRNAELAAVHYPGWTCRFYLDDSVPALYQAALAAAGCDIVKVTRPSLGPMYGRYWRMWVAADPGVDRFLIRDADSRLNARERAAVDEWIASGESFHVMRDSAGHRTLALAGMWGGVGASLPEIAALIDAWGQFDQHGQCDRFTSEVLFPRMQHSYICHDGAGFFDDGRPFPPHPPLDGTRYVGEIVQVDGPPVDIWRQSAELENRLFFELDYSRRLAAENRALKETLSWRVTAPLRRLKSRVARLQRPR